MATHLSILTPLIIDPWTHRGISTGKLAEIGDWQFLQLAHYTSVAPWTVTQGNTEKLTFQESDISFTAGVGLEINYDYVDQLFKPTRLNDLYFSEIRFKTRCSNQNGYGDVRVDVPTATFSPIQSSTIGIPKGAGVEQFVSLDGSIYIGQEVIDNGFEINFTAGSGNFEIYDVSLLSCRVGSGRVI